MTKAKARARQKDFGSPVVVDEMEPVGFDLYGQHFECRKQINGIALLRFVREANAEDGARSTQALLDIFERVMPKDEYSRFIELCEDPETIVPIETLSEIIGFLIEVYTERPTAQSGDS
jgi:hypothetical protein